MRRLARKIVKFRVPILIVAVVLLVPSFFGYVNTRINYDILYYLPDDIETMQGQQILLDDFGKGAYAMFVAEGMSDAEAARLREKLEQVDHVDDVIWYDSVLPDSIPQEILPEKYYDAFHNGDATLMAIFFDTSSSADETMDAIEEIRDVAGQQCFLGGMSAIATDTRDLVDQELPMYILIAVVLSCIVLAITMDSWMAPVLFMANIGMAIVYNLGTNIFKGEISFITMAIAAVLQLGVTMDYSIFLWNSYKEQKKIFQNKDEAMVEAIAKTISSVAGSALTTIAGFIALCFMTFTLGRDLGIVMAKGVVLGLVSCVTILPCLILVFDKAIVKTSHKPITVSGGKFAGWVVRHHVVLAVVMVALIVPAIIGYRNINVYYNLDSGLPDYLASVKAEEKLSDDFDIGTVHMVLADEDLSAKESRQMLSEMEDVDGVQLAMGADSVVPYQLPDEFLPEEATEMLKSGGRQLILITSEYPVASDEVNAQLDALDGILKSYDPEGMLIGEAACTRDLISITDHDFKVVSVISIVAIFVIIMLVLHSISLPVILVLVIELAIYINMSLAFYTQTPLPFIASIVISTVQLGATVDYAILMTNRYQRERSCGHGAAEAAKIALSTSLPSILTSALGFFAATVGVGIYSDVDLIGSMCILLARGAICSLGVVVLLLPSLLMIIDGLVDLGSRGTLASKI